MTDYVSPPNWANDTPLEQQNVQKLSINIAHLKEVISGTNIVKIVTAALADLCVTTAKIANLAVTDAKIALNAVTTTKIADSAVTMAKLDATTGSTGQFIKKTLTGWAAADLDAALDDLTDVYVPVPTAGDTLVYSHGLQVTPPDTTCSVADGGAGALTGTFTYKITFTDDYGETTGSAASASTGALSSRRVNLTSIPTGVGATGRAIYRSDGGAYQLVGTIADNSTTTFTDNNASPGATLPTENDTGELLWRGEAYAIAPGTPGQVFSVSAAAEVTWRDMDETWGADFPNVQVGDTFEFKYDDNYSVQQWAVKAKEGETGSIEFDILISNAPSTGGSWYNTFTSIVASAPPAISSGDYAEDATLTGWTTTLDAGRWVRYSVTSVSGITNAQLAMKVRRTD